MHRFKQNKVRFDSKELRTDLGKGNFIFVGSSCDMFAETIPHDWIANTLIKAWESSDNRYLFQSKNPFRISCYREGLPDSSVVCTTIETNRWIPSVMGNSPNQEDRARGMEYMAYHFDRYVTIEPVIDFDLVPMVELIKRCEPIQVNIGADSGNNHLPEPSADKLLALIDELSKFTTIAKKRNLRRILGDIS